MPAKEPDIETFLAAECRNCDHEITKDPLYWGQEGWVHDANREAECPVQPAHAGGRARRAVPRAGTSRRVVREDSAIPEGGSAAA